MMTGTGSVHCVTERGVGKRCCVAKACNRKGVVGEVKEQGESPSTLPDNPMARLVGLITSNDHLLAELGILDARLVEAEVYLAMASSNLELARAYRARTKRQRSRVLVLLRANRIAAREFLTR